MTALLFSCLVTFSEDALSSGRQALDSLCYRTTLRNLSISSPHHQHLPSQMSSLINLRCLSISFTGLRALPAELQQLSKLQYFSLRDCLSLTELPSWMDSLSELANLSLHRCSKLTSLPDLHNLQKLWKLDLSYCKSLSQLPAGFTKNGAFPTLKVKVIGVLMNDVLDVKLHHPERPFAICVRHSVPRKISKSGNYYEVDTLEKEHKHFSLYRIF